MFIAHRRESDGTFQSLSQHLIGTSKLAARFAAKIGLTDVGELLGLLHDIGKASPEFKQYLESATGMIDYDADDYVNTKGLKGKIDHSTAGAHYLFQLLHGLPQNALAAQTLALILASHHSGLIDCIDPNGEDIFSKRLKKPVSQVISNLDVEILERIGLLVTAPELVTKLNQKMTGFDCPFIGGLVVRFLFSCLIDADRLDTADFEFPYNGILRNYGRYESWDVLINKLENRLEKFCQINQEEQPMKPIREAVSNRCFEFARQKPGIYRLTVPAGGGKTLSSLRFALSHAEKWELDRIIYIIPYTSIIDQNAEVARQIFETKGNQAQIVLEHHSNLTPEEKNSRQKLLAEDWDAPIVFTTMVQFMEALFGGGTKSVRRMHQLANSVLIFDEIQTLPVQSVHLFNNAAFFLRQVCGSTLILCTATQPLLDQITPPNRALKIDGEIIADVPRLFASVLQVKQVNVEDKCTNSGYEPKDLALMACTEIKNAKSSLVITNTKRLAKEVYQEIPATVEKYHLSTAMCPAHRMAVLAQIHAGLKQNREMVCVSTQLIEAGVDIDFGMVIRCLAGLDSIAQAAGRCNRNGSRALGKVYVVNVKDEKISKFPEIEIGAGISDRVFRELASGALNGEAIGTAAIERYYRYYFYARQNLMAYPLTFTTLYELLNHNADFIKIYQRSSGIKYPHPVKYAFRTAGANFSLFDGPNHGIIVPYGEGAALINDLCVHPELESQYRLLRRAQQFSVNVFKDQFNKLLNLGIVKEIQVKAGIYYLDKRYYSPDFGVSETPV